MNNTVLRKIVWGLAILCMALIFYMSSRPIEASRRDSARVMAILGLADNVDDATDVTNWQMMSLQRVVRKYAHFIIYTILGILYFVSIYGYLGKALKTGAIATLLTALYGASDEFHQIFTSRGASVRDVLIDTLGGFVGILLVGLVFYLIENNTKAKAFFNKLYDFEPIHKSKTLIPPIR